MKRHIVILIAVMQLLAVIACGGNAGALGPDLGVAPENVRIEGLPQWVCPTEAPSHFLSWQTPTPYVRTFDFLFGDDVYTDNASASLQLRLRIDQVEVLPSTLPGVQIVIFRVQIENRGTTPYIIVPAAQLYVARIDSEYGTWWTSSEAATEAGIWSLAPGDGLRIIGGKTIAFQLAAYTPVGSAEAVAWILDPYANGYDGAIAGGNVGHWVRGTHDNCAGNVGTPFMPPPKLTPDPSATPTATLSACQAMACATVMP